MRSSMAGAKNRQLPPVVNPVLGYGLVRRVHLTTEELCESLLSTFEGWEFRAAIDDLWKFFDDERSDGEEILGEKPTQDPSRAITRSVAKADCMVVLKALKDLDDADALPDIAVSVKDLAELPPIAPHLEVSSYKRQVVWDTQVSNLEDELHQSQDALKNTLTSIEDGQKRMAEELAQVRHQLESLDAQVQSVPLDPRSSTPDLKKTIPHRTYADAVSEEPGRDTRRQNTDQLPNSRPWTYPAPRRRKPKVVTGTQECVDTFRGAPEVRSLFISNVRKDTEAEKVKRYIEDHCDGVICVRQWSHPEAPLRSFKVTVKKECVKDLLSTDFPWPKNVRVRRFVFRRGPPPTHVKSN